MKCSNITICKKPILIFKDNIYICKNTVIPYMKRKVNMFCAVINKKVNKKYNIPFL